MMLFQNKGKKVNEKEERKPQDKKSTDEHHEEKPKIDPKVNEASGFKGKEKIIEYDEEK